MAHPGDAYNQMSPHDTQRPVLSLDGRRSIFAWWPPEAVCENCGQHPENHGGYVGPVADSLVTYPAPETRFVCEDCARKAVGLQPQDLTGHRCGRRCTENQHVDQQIYDRSFRDLDDAGRLVQISPDYVARGWRVIQIQEAAGWDVPKVTGSTWWVTIVAARPTATR